MGVVGSERRIADVGGDFDPCVAGAPSFRGKVGRQLISNTPIPCHRSGGYQFPLSVGRRVEKAATPMTIPVTKIKLSNNSDTVPYHIV
jgi:hypothetical protein